MRDRIILRAVAFGVVGGIAGTFFMDIVMMITFISAGESADLFFTMVGEKFGEGAILGIAAHNLIGMTGGIIFALLVSRFEMLKLTSIKKGLKLGVAAGAITIPLGCIPLAIWLGESILGVIAFSIIPHLVWGTVLGWTVAYGVLLSETRPVTTTAQTNE